jgi:hypothetical protein
VSYGQTTWMCDVLSSFRRHDYITFDIIFRATRTARTDHGGNQKVTGGVHVRSGGSRRMLGRPYEFVERAGKTAKQKKQVDIYNTVPQNYY